MENTVISFASSSDINEILEIKKQAHEFFVESRPDIYKESEMLYTRDFFSGFFLDQNKRIVIAKIDNYIIGYAFIELINVDLPMMTSRKYMYVHDMAVSEEFRHQGIAKRMLRFIEDFSLENGASKLELAVHLFNNKAISLYDKIGFLPRSIRMEKDLRT